LLRHAVIYFIRSSGRAGHKPAAKRLLERLRPALASCWAGSSRRAAMKGGVRLLLTTLHALQALSADDSSASCPKEASLARDCGRARRASVGDCLVCMTTKHGACDSAQAERFCSGVAPLPVGFALVNSQIEGATAEGLEFVEDALPRGSQGQRWALCYDSRSDCTTCASATFKGSLGSTSCSCDWPTPKRSFHGGCDNHTETLILGHNGLGFTFGGFAQASWGNRTALGSWARQAQGDFLFRLGPSVATAYRPTGSDTYYQFCAPGVWPAWGSSLDLCFGKYDALGTGTTSSVGCHQGGTYEGEPNDVCGGRNFGAGERDATQMEVWYRVSEAPPEDSPQR
jgi:hypothetical protein